MAKPSTAVTAVAWIARGVASAEPQSVEIEQATLKELVESGGAGYDETTDSEAPAEGGRKRGLRGSIKADAEQSAANEKAGADKYNMDAYDEEAET